ncbi:NUDIX hydrolase [Asaccharospora irregularis]|uniref:ADP-ribose pyrophosphatase n=1 Tax=Asaccharospora irregularis DSM 2635 TaxID=1121321 RepID=A0A1M5K038_9FIRM|nr:NUDIX hydrolase [Asaccharospora irregularis]SHG46161.1 ADP-ribose pyrophosphatase [Asaccharospora irregularis DSM 2635]
MIVEEKTISSDKIYTGKVVSLRLDTVEIPGKGYQKREIVEHGGAVGIVALTEDKKLILVKQFRKPIEKVIWELPAGKLEIGENPKECAIRELKEETGYSAENIKLIHKFFTSAGFSNEKLYIYLATGLIKGDTHFDEDEFLDIFEVDFNEAYDLVLNNEVEDAKTSIGILLAKELIEKELV